MKIAIISVSDVKDVPHFIERLTFESTVDFSLDFKAHMIYKVFTGTEKSY